MCSNKPLLVLIWSVTTSFFCSSWKVSAALRNSKAYTNTRLSDFVSRSSGFYSAASRLIIDQLKTSTCTHTHTESLSQLMYVYWVVFATGSVQRLWFYLRKMRGTYCMWDYWSFSFFERGLGKACCQWAALFKIHHLHRRCYNNCRI